MKKIIDYTIDEIKSIITEEKFNYELCTSNKLDFVENIDNLLNSRIDFLEKNNIDAYQIGLKRKVLHMLRQDEKTMLQEYYYQIRIKPYEELINAII